MKKIVFLCLTLMAATVGFAQQQLATLNHNDSITVYYGASALQQAHAAAVNGDIITLSPGAFSAVDITKAVTIRGTGAWSDTNGTYETIILNSLYFSGPQDPLHHLSIEGIYFLNDVLISSSGLYNPQFFKCYFNGNFYCRYQNDGLMLNAMFVNCFLTTWFASYNNGPTGANNTHFVNSVISDSWQSDCPDTYINCILKQDPNNGYMVSRTFQNCILYYNYNYPYCPSGNSFTAQNCIFINIYGGSNVCCNLFSGHDNHVLWNMCSWNSVFSTTGYYELIDSIAATCLGNDGTQVGIYGGAFPFDPQVSGLNIRRLDVARRTTADGKLPVDIEIVSDEATSHEENE